MGLRNDDIFADTREAKGIESLTLGGKNLGAWEQQAGLDGERKPITSLKPSSTAVNVSMVYLQASFKMTATTIAGSVVVLDASGLGRGHAFINGFDIGMYWPVVPVAKGGTTTSQRYYHIPPDCLRTGANTLLVLEEAGAPRPELVRIATVLLK